YHQFDNCRYVGHHWDLPQTIIPSTTASLLHCLISCRAIHSYRIASWSYGRGSGRCPKTFLLL
ncbi:hypothetical protein WG66_007668, partial [Moniliophthora roreri]